MTIPYPKRKFLSDDENNKDDKNDKVGSLEEEYFISTIIHMQHNTPPGQE